MQHFTEYLLSCLLRVSWQGAVLIILVIAVQQIFRSRLNPRWRYGLWLLVVLRLALPLTIHSRASVFNLLKFTGVFASLEGLQTSPERPASTEARADAGAQKQPAQVLALQPSPWSKRSRSNLLWLLGIWLAGVLTLAIYVVVAHWRLSRRVLRRPPLLDATVLQLLQDCKQQMGVRAPVMLVETGEVGSPSLFGFVRPRLLLPAGLTRSFSLEELRYVFLHELGHIKRCDILVGWLMTFLQILHWFNPLVWLAFYRMRADRELACDALALSHANADENQRYGNTIIKLLESFGRSAWAPSLAGAVESKNQLKERISMIGKFKNTNRVPALAMALIAGLGAVTLTDAQPGVSETSQRMIGTWILVGAPGEVGEAPAAGGRLKSWTDGNWSMTQVDPENGVTVFHHGGTYTLNGNEYVETVEYANNNTKDRIGKTHKYTVKVEGDTLTQVGLDNPWKEVWKRVKPESKPHKSETSVLEGTWRGHEIGGRTAGTCSLILRGSNLEFHGADTNEWYKARFAAYDTTPKQLVVVITDCPFAQYIGRTGYAIYKLQDGKFTLTGNEPGELTAPSGFDAPGARKLVFEPQ